MHLAPRPSRTRGPAGLRCGPGANRSVATSRGFTLLEVALAMGLFFAMVFILLQITSTNLRIAKALQHTSVDASSLAAEISLTNQLAEGSDSGDFGELHPGYEWRREITLVGTNGLFEVRFEIFNGRKSEPDSELVVLLFRPDSAQRAGGGALRR